MATQSRRADPSVVQRLFEAAPEFDFFQAVRQVEAIERQDRAQPRFDPMDRRVVRPVGHRENALRIGAQQQRRVDGFNGAGHSPLFTRLRHQNGEEIG